MINFTKLNTKKILLSYKNLKLFPLYNGKFSLDYFYNKISKTGYDHNISYSLISSGTYPIKKYLRCSFIFSMQDFQKSLAIFLNDLSVSRNRSEFYIDSNRYLNLYYSYLFISRAILSFHGILFNGNKVGKQKRFSIYVNYLFLSKETYIQKLLTDKGNPISEHKQYGINHQKFWKKFYSFVVASRNTDGLLLNNLITLNGSNVYDYFKSNRFIKNYNASNGRNFYTYRYSSFIDFGISNIKESVKTSNAGISILKRDVSILENVVRYNIIYLLALIKVISDPSDFEKLFKTYFNILSSVDLTTEKRDIYNEVEILANQLNSAASI